MPETTSSTCNSEQKTQQLSDSIYQAQLSQALKVITRKHHQDIRNPKTAEECLNPVVSETIETFLSSVATITVSPGKFNQIINQLHQTLTELKDM